MVFSLALLGALVAGNFLSAQTPPASMFPMLPPADVRKLTPSEPIRQIQSDVQPKSPSGLPLPKDPKLAQNPRPELPRYSTNTQQDLLDLNVRLDPPGPELLFGRLDSEESLMERMRQEDKNRPLNQKIQFPEKPVLSNVAFTARVLPGQTLSIEPRFTMYHRLYFEEKNSERYGWELGLLQPAVSTLVFYKDVLFLPHKLVSNPHRRFDSDAGYCLPGDPIPYLLYPPEITLGGSAVQAGVIVGLFAVIP